MGKPVRERVSAYRQRLKDAGMVHLSLVVPASEAAFFRQMASLTRHAQASNVPDEHGAPPHRKALTAAEVHLAEHWATRSGLKLRLTRPGLRLSEVLARNIAHEIVVARWPLGATLGTEPQLLQRYGVSRGVLREAIRLLESQSIAAMRRGAGGGLIVAEPTVDSVAYPAGVFLESRRFQADQMLKTRRTLELHILDRCFECFNDEAREALARCLVFESSLDESASGLDLQRFHLILAKLTGDPSLELFLDILLRKARFESPYYRARKSDRNDIVNGIRQTHAAIARGLMSGNRPKAIHAMDDRFGISAQWLI